MTDSYTKSYIKRRISEIYDILEELEELVEDFDTDEDRSTEDD